MRFFKWWTLSCKAIDWSESPFHYITFRMWNESSSYLRRGSDLSRVTLWIVDCDANIVLWVLAELSFLHPGWLVLFCWSLLVLFMFHWHCRVVSERMWNALKCLFAFVVSCIVRTPACLCYALVTMLGWCSSILLGKSSSNDWRKSALAKRTCCNDIGFQDVYCAVWCFQERHTQSVAGCMVQTRHTKLSGYSLPDSGWWLCEANHRVIEHPWTSSLPFQPVEICRALDSWQRTHRWPQFPIFAELSQGSHTWSILKISGWWKIKEYERNVDLQD